MANSWQRITGAFFVMAGAPVYLILTFIPENVPQGIHVKACHAEMAEDA